MCEKTINILFWIWRIAMILLISFVMIQAREAFAKSTGDGVDLSLPIVGDADGTPRQKVKEIKFPNDATSITGRVATIDFTAPLAGTYLKLDCSNDPLTAALDIAPNEDITNSFGRWKMGYDGTNADLATLSHYDNMAWDTWALAQDSSAGTYLNGADMTYFMINGITKMRLYPSGGTDDRFHLVTDVSLCLGGSLGSERVFLDQSGSDPTLLTMSTPYSNLGFVIEGDITAIDGTYSGTVQAEQLTSTDDISAAGIGLIGGVTSVEQNSFTFGGNTLAQWKMNDNLPTTAVVENIIGLTSVWSSNTEDSSIVGVTNRALYSEANKHCQINDTTGLVISGNYSMSVWVYHELVTNAADRYIMSSKANGDAVGFDIWFDYSEGKLCSTIDTAHILANDAMVSDQWYHITVTWNGVIRKMYIDNVLQTDTSGTGAITLQTKMAIGAKYISPNFSSATRWYGAIDNAIIFDKALSSAEIGQLYNSGNGVEDITDTVVSNTNCIGSTATVTTLNAIDGQGSLVIEDDLEVLDKTYLENDVSLFKNSSSGDTPYFDLYGYVTASGGTKYVRFNIDDTDDYMHITPEDANVLGADIVMPLRISETAGTNYVEMFVDSDNVFYMDSPTKKFIFINEDDGELYFGPGAGQNLGTNVSGNILVGNNAGGGASTTYINQNVYIGANSGLNSQASLRNIGIGENSLRNCTLGYNVAIGRDAMYSSSSAEKNVAIGTSAAQVLSFGDNNVVIGYGAGLLMYDSDGCVFIGYQAGANSSSVNNRLYIANSDTATPLIYGEFDTPMARINGAFNVTGITTVNDAIYFTQTDGNESIDSIDNYMKYYATLGHDFNATLDITTTTDPQLRLTHTDGVDECDFWVNSDGQLEIMPTGGLVWIGDGTAGDYTLGFYGNTTQGYLQYIDATGRFDFSEPISIATGALLGTPVSGTFEFSNDRMYLTNVAVRKAVSRANDVLTSTVTVANTTTETTIYTSILTANALKAGNDLTQITSGLMTSASAADTITGRIKIGGVTVLTVTSRGSGVLTNDPWHFAFDFTVRDVGATATIAYHADLFIDGSNHYGGTATIDTTSAADVTITMQWNNAKAGNSLSILKGVTDYKN